MQEYQYILFPLPILQEVFKKPQEGINHILKVGIYRTAQTLRPTAAEALKQGLYCFYRGGLTHELTEQFNSLEKKKVFQRDYDHSGFSTTGYSFNPQQETTDLLKYMENDPKFTEKLIEFQSLRKAKDLLQLSFSYETVTHYFRTYETEYGGFKNCPLVSLKTDLMFEFRDDKTDFQKALFAMYAGIKSLIGDKTYVATTREMIVCRMFGAKNPKALEGILKDKKVKAAYKQFSKRYQFEKLLNHLLAENFLSAKIGIKRRTYLSCQLGYTELAQKVGEHIDGEKMILSIKSHKENELEAKKLINQHL